MPPESPDNYFEQDFYYEYKEYITQNYKIDYVRTEDYHCSKKGRVGAIYQQGAI